MVVKKWFSLLAVTSLTGLVASASASGCTDETVVPLAPGGGTDSGTDTGSKKPPTTPPTGDQEEPKSECPIDPFQFSEKEVEAETKGPWMPPKQVKGACTDDEIKTLGKNIDNSDETTPIDDFAKGLTAPCKSCLFSTSTDKNWQIIIAIPGADKTAGFINFGACHAVEETDACGKDYQYNQFCVNTACSKCSESEDAACLDTVWGKDGACDGINTSTETNCQNLEESLCGETTEEHAAILCGGGAVVIKDAGNDG